MKEWISIFLKGVAMGAANVIPGVSGGTVAFVTGIYERLIHALKSFGGDALGLLLERKFTQFAKKVDLAFLVALGVGVLASILTLARVLKYLFANHAVLVWAFFFGLIFASIFFVGNKVKRWGAGPIIAILVGTAIAILCAMVEPASENTSLLYLLLCGVVAMASMIIPGLSGSYVLILLGNYQLIMIDSVTRLSEGDWSVLRILVPVGVGAVLGLLALSHLLSWIFRKFHDVAVALLTGFVAGSLLLIWPWKKEIKTSFGTGDEIDEKVTGYEWFLPALNGQTFLAIAVMVLGFVAVYLMERLGSRRDS